VGMNNEISYNSIHSFTARNRSDNDENNKKREQLICAVINKNIPREYYKYSPRWYNLKKAIKSYIRKLCRYKNIARCDNVVCIHKAGRNHKYDLEIKINNIEVFNVEFKFNAVCVNDAPQFISPMKPSQYMNASYEEYYYDNYLIQLSNNYNLSIPTREVYLNKIHNNKPRCMALYQEKYYRGCNSSSRYSGDMNDIEFYKTAKEKSDESIANFISMSELNIDSLSDHLLNTQRDKCYMLYRDGHINLENINQDNYIITHYRKDRNRFIATTRTGRELKILLRWKNGNGIAFPAFQIK
tara:strand:+ start:338 stop:1231 length:894 start_codon:yes stop_codon:yes gene_type:complete